MLLRVLGFAAVLMGAGPALADGVGVLGRCSEDAAVAQAYAVGRDAGTTESVATRALADIEAASGRFDLIAPKVRILRYVYRDAATASPQMIRRNVLDRCERGEPIGARPPS